MNIGADLAVPADVEEDFLKHGGDWQVFGLKGEEAGEDLRNHDIEVLADVVLGEYSPVENQVAGPRLVVSVDVFYLLVQGCPVLTHVASHEKTAS